MNNDRYQQSKEQDPIKLWRIDEWILPITLNTALHIGTGVENERTDSPVLTAANGSPLIPGSSLKGVFRSISERLAHVLGLDSCQLDKGGCSHQNKQSISQLLASPAANDREVYEQIQTKYLCATCRLYGSGVMASRLSFMDLTLPTVHTHVRNGVVIDRDTGAAAPGLKYDYEIVYADAPVLLRIILENAQQDDLLLLGLAIHYLYHGAMRIGGGSSRGLGEIQPYQQWEADSGFHWRVTDLKNPDHAWRYFLKESIFEDRNWQQWKDELKRLTQKAGD